MLKMHNYWELAEVAGADIHTGLQASSRAHCLPGIRVCKQYRLLDNYFLLLSVFGSLIRIRIRIHRTHMCFGPPGSGSGSISQRYGSGSGSASFYHSAKIVRKILMSTVLWLLFDFLPLNNYVNIPSKSNRQKNFLFISFLLIRILIL